ncbi:hypothetical protein FSP39_023073 [Pinctada imbricata]|uniref:Methyltransferase HEMK2 n=1 Tax=Pinctada imbricata TaxID=66713 RepID=A0AA88XNL7_PINIB|nr:hypothetical protein FSP39_023073 [Pinctada imbricata]
MKEQGTKRHSSTSTPCTKQNTSTRCYKNKLQTNQHGTTRHPTASTPCTKQTNIHTMLQQTNIRQNNCKNNKEQRDSQQHPQHTQSRTRPYDALSIEHQKTTVKTTRNNKTANNIHNIHKAEHIHMMLQQTNIIKSNCKNKEQRDSLQHPHHAQRRHPHPYEALMNERQSTQLRLADISHITTSDANYVYEPAEDSFLFLDALQSDYEELNKSKPNICLEVGCGSGVCITFLAKMLGQQAAVYWCTDINPHAVCLAKKTAQQNGIVLEAVQTDLMQCFEARLAGEIDVLLFNPPYVVTPSEEVGGNGIEASWAGGLHGREVIDRFLPIVPKFLSKSGVLYLVVVKENKPGTTRQPTTYTTYTKQTTSIWCYKKRTSDKTTVKTTRNNETANSIHNIHKADAHPYDAYNKRTSDKTTVKTTRNNETANSIHNIHKADAHPYDAYNKRTSYKTTVKTTRNNETANNIHNIHKADAHPYDAYNKRTSDKTTVKTTRNNETANNIHNIHKADAHPYDAYNKRTSDKTTVKQQGTTRQPTTSTTYTKQTHIHMMLTTNEHQTKQLLKQQGTTRQPTTSTTYTKQNTSI